MKAERFLAVSKDRGFTTEMVAELVETMMNHEVPGVMQHSVHDVIAHERTRGMPDEYMDPTRLEGYRVTVERIQVTPEDLEGIK